MRAMMSNGGRLALIVALCCAVVACGKPKERRGGQPQGEGGEAGYKNEVVAGFSQFALDLMNEHNYARTKPAEYAERFIKPHFGKTQGYAERCYKEMTAMQPVGKLRLDERCCQASQWFAEDLVKSGKIGHVGSDGSSSSDRLRRVGVKWIACAENCSWGVPDARGVLVQLLIDEGVQNEGHRKNILSPNYMIMGVGRAEGGRYGVATVIDYARE